MQHEPLRQSCDGDARDPDAAPARPSGQLAVGVAAADARVRCRAAAATDRRSVVVAPPARTPSAGRAPGPSKSAIVCPPGSQNTCEEQFGPGKYDCCKIPDSVNYQCCFTGKCCGGPCCDEDEVCKDKQCVPACRYTSPVLGSTQRAYDPKKECCTRTGVQPKFKDFSARACEKTLTPRPAYKPTRNGCGSKDFDVPDTWPARGKGRKAKFTPACNVHDYCYGTCKSDKDECDKAFCRNLKLACKQTWPDKADRKRRAGCDDRADLYCAGVILAGDSAYWNAQEEACHCCP